MEFTLVKAGAKCALKMKSPMGHGVLSGRESGILKNGVSFQKFVESPLPAGTLARIQDEKKGGWLG